MGFSLDFLVMGFSLDFLVMDFHASINRTASKRKMKGMENRYIVFLTKLREKRERGERERGERERERERELELETLFYKDFSLGSQRESLWPKQRLLVTIFDVTEFWTVGGLASSPGGKSPDWHPIAKPH